LAEAVAWRESVTVVPAAEIIAGSGKARAHAELLEQPVFVNRNVGGMDSVKLLLERPASELHVGIPEQEQPLARGCLRRSGADVAYAA